MTDEVPGQTSPAGLTFGALLRVFRTRAWQSQDELARRSGISVRTISKLERDRARNPRSQSIQLLGDALELTADDRTWFEATARSLSSTPADAMVGWSAPSRVHAPCQLPPDVLDFTGRTAQVALLTTQLTDAAANGVIGLVAVAGQAGVGKTALAVHVAHRLRSAFPDGQLYVNLHGAELGPLKPFDVLTRFLRALDVTASSIPRDSDECVVMLRTIMADRRILMVLDNAASDAQVRPLLPGTSGCAVIVTSRSRLVALEGAHLVDLDVLEQPMAVELLGQIAGRRRVEAELVAAETIVARCGCLPLAVRIAGARLAARPSWRLGRMVDLLADEHGRLDQLAVGDLEVRASLTLSYEALAPEHRRAFRLLAMLGATDFAAWIAGPLLDVSTRRAELLVEALADAHLLDLAADETVGGARYRFHDLVRIFGRERVRDEEPDHLQLAAVKRVTAAWLAVVEAADGRLPCVTDVVTGGQAPRWRFSLAELDRFVAEPLDWLELERVNVIAAVHDAAARGLDQAAWELAGFLTTFLRMRSYWSSIYVVHGAALAVCRQAGNRRGAAAAVTGIGYAMLETPRAARLHEGWAMLDHAVETFRALGDRRGEAKALHALSEVQRAVGRYEGSAELLGDAVVHAQRAQCVARSIGDLGIEADALIAQGAASAHLGRWGEATRALEAARALVERLGAVQGLAATLFHLAMVRIGTDQLVDAATLLEEALLLVGMLGDQRRQAQVLLELGKVRTLEGRLDQAEALLRAAGRAWSPPRNHAFRAQQLLALGQLRQRMVRYDEAALLLTQAILIAGAAHAEAIRQQGVAALANLSST